MDTRSFGGKQDITKQSEKLISPNLIQIGIWIQLNIYCQSFLKASFYKCTIIKQIHSKNSMRIKRNAISLKFHYYDDG